MITYTTFVHVAPGIQIPEPLEFRTFCSCSNATGTETFAKNFETRKYDSTPACLTCQAVDQLKVCSRCNIAKYCSAVCQKKDISVHEKDCKTIQRLADAIASEEKTLVSRRLLIRNNRGDPFRSITGFVENFGRVQSASTYLQTLYDLCKVLLQMARKRNSGYALEAALDHFAKMSRLCYLISFKVEHLIPFLLLDLNRDLDAHAFTVFWIGTEFQIGIVPLLGSRVLGLTLREMSSIFDVRPGFNLHEMDFKFLKPTQTAFLAALILIKARAIEFESDMDNFQKVLTEANHPLRNAKPVEQAIRKQRPQIPDKQLKLMKEQVICLVMLVLQEFLILFQNTYLG